MIAELVIREGAAFPLVCFVIAGVLGCLIWLWWLWFTLWEQGCCGKVAKECRCRERDDVG